MMAISSVELTASDEVAKMAAKLAYIPSASLDRSTAEKTDAVRAKF